MLSQRYMFTSKSYILKERGLMVRSQRIGNFSEQTVPYEAVTFNTSRSHASNGQFVWAAIGCGFVSIVVLISLMSDETGSTNPFVASIPMIGCIVFAYLSVISRKKLINIELITDPPQYIQLVEDAPNAEDVDKFTCDLFAKVKEYMKEKYIDSHLPIDEQILRLRNLYDRNIIEKVEYEELTVKARYS